MDTLLLGLLIGLVLVLLYLQLRKSDTVGADVSTPLQNLIQAIHKVDVRTATLAADISAATEVEKQTSNAIRRLEMIIAGSSSKGAAGERVVGDILSKLPPEWQVRNFRVSNKPVEFGLWTLDKVPFRRFGRFDAQFDPCMWGMLMLNTHMWR